MRSKAGRQKNDGQLESSIKVQSAAVFQREALAGVLAQETPGEPLALFTTELFTNLQEKHSSSTVLTAAGSAAQFTDLQIRRRCRTLAALLPHDSNTIQL